MQHATRSAVAVVVLSVGVSVSDAGKGPALGETLRASVNALGDQLVGNTAGSDPIPSANGRYVSFSSRATNVDPADASTNSKMYVRDVWKGTMTRVDIGLSGVPADNNAFDSAVSANGRYIAFYSHATNLVPGDTNGKSDVFVLDRKKGALARVSLRSVGGEDDGFVGATSLSANGKVVAWESAATNSVEGDTNGVYDVFVRKWRKGTTERVSVASDGTEGDVDSYNPSVSGSGRFVAFESDATNLVTGDGNGTTDVFVRDRKQGSTSRVSVSSAGVEADGASDTPEISRNGRYIVFQSGATNLVDDDTNGKDDVFVHDWKKGVTTRVSVATGGVEANGRSGDPSISLNGRYVAFYSEATNLDGPDANGSQHDLFVHDRKTGRTVRVGLSSSGQQSSGRLRSPRISGNGRIITFAADADDLDPADTNGLRDAYVRRFR